MTSHMFEPQVDVEYWLVKVQGDSVQPASFERFADGSAYAAFHLSGLIAEEDPDAWREAWGELLQEGYVLVDDAKAKGLIPSEWSVPEDFGQGEAHPSPL